MIARILRHPDATVVCTYTTACIAFALLFLSLIPYLHEFWWLLELPGHFYPHIATVSTLVGIIALTIKAWRTSALASVAAAICWTTVLAVPTSPHHDSSGIVVVSQNLYRANNNADKARRVILQEDPDVVVFQEYTAEWHESLTSIADQYETTITVPREGAFGIAVFSKLPVSSHEVLMLGDTGVPAIALEIDTPQLKANLIAVHLQSPTSGYLTKDRNHQLNELKVYIQGLSGAYVVVGDFNNTPYAPSLRAFIDETRTKLGRPIWKPTWPSNLGWAGIPIDLALGSDGTEIGSTFRIEPIGSDHRGIRFSVTAQQK